MIAMTLIEKSYTNHGWVKCNFSAPESSLILIASLLKTIPWLEDAKVEDSSLFMKITHDGLWLLHERSLHNALKIAREEINKVFENSNKFKPEIFLEVILDDKEKGYLYSGSKAVSSTGQGFYKIAEPDKKYSSSFVVEKNDEKYLGYYVTSSSRYGINPERKIAVDILRLMLPEAGIGVLQETSYGEIPIEVRVEDIEIKAMQAYSMAFYLVKNFSKRLTNLEWGGAPSAFLEEDNDARDMLLQRMKNGEKIQRTRMDLSRINGERHGYCKYHIGDEEIAPHVALRLMYGGAIKTEAAWDRVNEPLSDLVFDPRYSKDLEDQRSNAVQWQSFSNYCQYRRRDNDCECSNRKMRADVCSEMHCPLVSQIYSEETGIYQRSFENDPAFDSDRDWEKDFLVRALHPNTKRSFAWRASGEDAEIAVVNQALHSHLVYRAPFLFGKEVEKAVRRAAEKGYLDITEEMEGFGTVAKPSELILEKIKETRNIDVEKAEMREEGKV